MLLTSLGLLLAGALLAAFSQGTRGGPGGGSPAGSSQRGLPAFAVPPRAGWGAWLIPHGAGLPLHLRGAFPASPQVAAWTLTMSKRGEGMRGSQGGGSADRERPATLMPKPLRPQQGAVVRGGSRGASVPYKSRNKDGGEAQKRKAQDPQAQRNSTSPAPSATMLKSLADLRAESTMVSVSTGDLFNGDVDPSVVQGEDEELFLAEARELSSMDHRLVNFRRASIERNLAIRRRQRKRWARQRSEEGRAFAQGAGVGEADRARAYNVTEEQNQWYNLISGASFKPTQNSSVLYYESLVERTILRVAKWTKETPSVDRFFRPIDAILDAFLTRTRNNALDSMERGKRRYSYFGRNRRRMYPLPVQQGVKYPVRMTRGVRSDSGTVYSMQDQTGVGVKRQRKELRLANVAAAWYGDPAFPWVATVADSDGTWITVGFDVTDVIRRRVHRGVLAVPLPFQEFLGDPCAGVAKTLMINYTDKGGENKSVEWTDGSGAVVDYLQAIRATYSPQRLANIVRGDISEVGEAINETRPLISMLRHYLRTCKPGQDGKSYELEARLGFVQGIDGLDGARARFENGVSREFMDRVLDLCEEWQDWQPISAWSESHDFIFRVGNTQMRTSVTCEDGFLSSQSKHNHVRRTVKKRILKLKDYTYVSTLGGVPRTGMLSADVRVALSEETEVQEEDLPEWGKERRPLRVRIKQRRSFHYTPPGSERPVWRFDFTLVWSAKSLGKAQMKQWIEEPAFELECELLDPMNYLEEEHDDTVVAKGLLLKLRDFLEPWGGYRLELVRNKPFPPGHPRHYQYRRFRN